MFYVYISQMTFFILKQSLLLTNPETTITSAVPLTFTYLLSVFQHTVLVSQPKTSLLWSTLTALINLQPQQEESCKLLRENDHMLTCLVENGIQR